MNWRSEHGKSGLIKMLMREHGISKRKAEEAVNAVFDCMILALSHGDFVELPIGVISIASRPPGRKPVVQHFSNIQTGKKFRKLVRPPQRFIRFRPDRKLIQKGPFPLPPPPPPSPASIQKQEELCQLWTRLGFSKEITLPELKSLLAAADENLDRLLARLRELVQRERKFTNYLFLCAAVRQLFWIR